MVVLFVCHFCVFAIMNKADMYGGVICCIGSKPSLLLTDKEGINMAVN